MTSSTNLLIDTHRLEFDDDMIDKLIVLRVNKKFMEIMRSKTTFATMTFEAMDASERIKFKFCSLIYHYYFMFSGNSCDASK